MNLNDLINKKILIVGDVMIDTYHIGKVKRISPEAPVPVVQITQTYSVLGGAANVARNLIGLRCNPYVIGMIGKDYNGELISQMFSDANIETNLIRTNSPTITKTRVLGNNQQIVRIDFENAINALESEKEHEIIKILADKLLQFDVVVISDYGKGMCSENVCKYIIELSNQYNKIVVIDPKGNNWDKYSYATIITPNLKELSDITNNDVRNEDKQIHEKGRLVLEKYKLSYILITRSEKGMTLVSPYGYSDVKAEVKEVFDVSGAGDTVVATLSACLAAGFSIDDSIFLANKAAGIVVGKVGTTPISYTELEQSVYLKHHGRKTLRMDELGFLINSLRQRNKSIVFTNGCFDILHKGHVYYLQEAKKKGDILIVGVNSDNSVKHLKGLSRPINNEEDRLAVLEGLECIDYLVVFDNDTPYDLIKYVKPDVLVKGGDYKIEEVIGREFANQVVLIDFQKGYSSTNIINLLG